MRKAFWNAHERDRFHDECGVFGVHGHPEAANITYLGLYAQQHRGQEAGAGQGGCGKEEGPGKGRCCKEGPCEESSSQSCRGQEGAGQESARQKGPGKEDRQEVVREDKVAALVLRL